MMGETATSLPHLWHCPREWKRLNHAIEWFGHDLSIFLPVAVSNGGNYFLLRLAEPGRGAVCF